MKIKVEVLRRRITGKCGNIEDNIEEGKYKTKMQLKSDNIRKGRNREMWK